MPLTGAHLRRLGVRDPERASALLAGLPGPEGAWARGARRCADPDQMLLLATRLFEAAPAAVADAAAGADERLERLCAVLGASAWLGEYLIARPGALGALWEPARDARAEVLGAVGAHSVGPVAGRLVAAEGTGADDLRRAYRRVQLGIAADDLTSEDAPAAVPGVGRRLAELADASLEAALALARRDADPGAEVPLAVIAMGKTGAQELNYISDVDVVYATEATDCLTEQEAASRAARLASLAAAACSGPGAEAPLWTVDANLRPEGRDGALVRTIDSYVAYWRKWAQTWEFQALLKARAAAGDTDLGRRFEEAAAPFVWSAATRDGFVDAARRMRTRVEESVRGARADQEIKLGRGGLRDVEFTVQLLQLVHGRTDGALRVRGTTEAIGALARGGYIGRADAAELCDCYAFLRAVEHRAQLPRMRRTHLVPAREAELRALGRALDPGRWPGAQGIGEEIARVRSRVRALHEDVFYRPIVAATAGLSAQDAVLGDEGARDRLAAIGYAAPAAALSHIGALTKGTSRRATIQRHLLPVLISWLADGADPDMGLLNFRALSEQIGDSHWYLALLRDSGAAASRLMSMLPNSRWIAEALSTRPEAVAWLDDDAELEARPRGALVKETLALVERHPGAEEAADRVRAVRSRELTRAAAAQLVGGVDPASSAVSDATDAALLGALRIAERDEEERWGRARAHVLLVAMGRYGGRESSFASDADVVAVHRAASGASEEEAAASALAVVGRVRELLGAPGPQMGVSVDLGLRPEGRNGPMSRSLGAYADYFCSWSSPWERQALLRARPIGSGPLADAYLEVIDPVRYGPAPDGAALREIRLLKARMEAERLPRGADPALHVKLGPGGLADVEWTIQLLQLRHARDCTALRATGTRAAIGAAHDAGLLSDEDADTLLGAWELASRIRAGNALASGRMTGGKLDILGRDARDLAPLARILGYPGGSEGALEERWRQSARRARAVMEHVFWESDS